MPPQQHGVLPMESFEGQQPSECQALAQFDAEFFALFFLTYHKAGMDGRVVSSGRRRLRPSSAAGAGALPQMDSSVKPRLVWKVMEMAQEDSREWEGDWMWQGAVVVVGSKKRPGWRGSVRLRARLWGQADAWASPSWLWDFTRVI